MDFSKYLLENLLDVYEEYCSCVEGMSTKEIDEMYYDSNGHEMSDEEFLFLHSDTLLEDEIIDALYTFICDMGNQQEIDINRIVSFLSGRYIIYHYESNIITNYLRASDIEDIAYLFIENINFGMELVRNHFKAIIDQKKYNNNMKTIRKNNDEVALNKFATKVYYKSIKTLNDLLRGVIAHLYDFYISSGYKDEEALNMTWLYFFQNLDPLGELDRLGIDYNTKQLYKKYALSLIYADLYEDVYNKAIIDSDNDEDKITQVVPLIAMNMGVIAIPSDEETRNRILKHFILLQDEKDKMIANRTKTYKDGRVKELKRFNPLYRLDDIKL